MKRLIFAFLISFSFILSSNAEVYYGPDNKIDYGAKEYENGDFKTTFNKVLKLAKNGDIEGQVRLAYLYHFGQGVVKNINEAIYWYRKSALQGHPLAAGNLAGFYKDGTIRDENGNKDYDNAIYWYQKASLAQGVYKGTVDEGALEDLKDIEINLLPSNSQISKGGWKCDSGYTRSANNCIKNINIPPNAYASGSGWKCNYGYQRSGNSCVKESVIPPNAYASGAGWKCNPGFEKQGNSCREIEDETIYQAGSGSGFATTKEGHILTNHHVIDGCSEVLLFKNGKSYIANLVTQDPNNDLAILQSDYKPSKVYPLSNEVYLSDDIFAAGFPFGKKISSAITINKGIISALMGPGDDISIFQIDADINSGNSGGPIVDRRGNAVGIAVAKLNAERAQEELKLGSTPEGFNFAVNSMMAIGLFRSQGIDLPPQNNSELSVKERNDLFNQGTFYLSCGMTIAQYEKMIKTDKVMFTRDVFFSNFEGN